jgi:peptidoglycan hydrolase CwlO-like protein
MVDKIKDVPAWAKYAAIVIVTVVGTVWTAGEIKGSFMVNDALADQMLQSHEKKLTTHDTKLDNHESRIDTIESTQTLITTSQDRIENKVDKQCDKVDDLIKAFHGVDKKLEGLNVYIKSIESIDNGDSD